ncbi:MAG: family 10 glycosylhydrolase, partial [Myxococcota bacterium]
MATTARRGLALGILAIAACGDPEPPPKPPQPQPQEEAIASRAREPGPARRGLWVLCEGSQRILEHPERFDALLADANRLAVTDLFVQVYRGGRAWFDSSKADAAPHRAILEQTGRDTLAELIPRAHAAGLSVHAWVNVLSLAGNTSAPLLRLLGPEAVLVDNRGRSILDYPNRDVPEPDRAYYRMGTPAVWLDPAAPGVAPHLAETVSELLVRYPELDGLHLDYIRYPDVLPFVPGSRFGVGLDFGYGEATRARFRKDTGLEAPAIRALPNPKLANRWDAWRRDQ